MNYSQANQVDRHAYLDSLIHRLDPRAKVLATLAFIVTVVSFHKYEVASLTPFVLFPLSLSILGFIPAGLILRRLLWASPFVILIGAMNPLWDRTVRLELGGIAISGGWVSFTSILLRGFLCVAAGVALIATTSVPRTAEALGRLRVPRALVVQLMLLYRYLFLLVAEASRLQQARALRAGDAKLNLTTATAMISTLLVRSVDRSQGIYQAMQLRGFDGHLRTTRKMEWQAKDTLFLALVVFGCLAFRLLPVTQWLGAGVMK